MCGMSTAAVWKRMNISYEKMDKGVGEGTSNLHLTNKLETHVMVVDDDLTTLSLIDAMLKTWKYKVVAVRNPMEALSTLRINHTQIDIVVTDLYMPEMNGIELQRQVQEEFKIPVVIMSSNDEESVKRETLEGGAVFYLVKPVKRDDLKNIWQFSISAKDKGKAVGVGKTGTNTSNNIIIGDGYSFSSSDDEKISVEDQGSSSSSANEGIKTSTVGGTDDHHKNKKRDSNNKRKLKKRSTTRRENSDAYCHESRTHKRTKVVWTNALHDRFLQAIRHIGLDRAVPKMILEFMAMPGLTRENVASHLQKYRLFLKRVSEQGTASCKTLTNRVLRSSFATGHPWLQMSNNLQQNYPHNLNFNLQKGRQFQSQLHPGFGFPSLTASSLGLTGYPYNQQGSGSSTSNSVNPRLGYGQSSLSNNNLSHFPTSLFGNRNLMNYPANDRSVLASDHNNINGTNFPSQQAAGLNLLLSGTTSSSSGLIYQQQNQARPHLDTNTSQLFNFGTPLQTQGSDSTPNTNYNNFGGIRIASDGKLIGQGQINCTNLSSGLDHCGYGLMNGITSNSNNNVNLSPIQTNRGFGYFGQGAAGPSYSVSDRIINQIPPTFGNNVGQQASATELPPVPPQQYHELSGNNNGAAGGENLTSNSDPFDNNAPHLGGIGDLNDILLPPTSTNFLQQEGQSVEGADFMDGSLNSELSPTLYEFLNCVDLPSSYHLDDNDPWDEQLPGQIPATDEVLNPNLGESAYPLDGYIPILEEQKNGGAHVMDSGNEVSGIIQRDNANFGNQQSNDVDMEDDFVNALLAGDISF